MRLVVKAIAIGTMLMIMSPFFLWTYSCAMTGDMLVEAWEQTRE